MQAETPDGPGQSLRVNPPALYAVAGRCLDVADELAAQAGPVRAAVPEAGLAALTALGGQVSARVSALLAAAADAGTDLGRQIAQAAATYVELDEHVVPQGLQVPDTPAAPATSPPGTAGAFIGPLAPGEHR